MATSGTGSATVRTTPAARFAAALAGVITALLIVVAPGSASAHDGDVDAIPPSGSTFDEPIDEVELTFQTDIADDVEIALLDPDETPIETTATKVSDRVARAEFEPLAREGTYIVRYLGVASADGHLLIGAVSFTYGSGSGGSSVLPWVLFGVAAIAILGAGAWFSMRSHRRNHAPSDDRITESADVDQDLPDVRV